MLTREEETLRSIGCYFYFPEREIRAQTINCTAVAIAEGLSQLGFRCYSNVANDIFVEKALKNAAEHFVVFEVTERNDSKDLMRGISEFRCRGKIINSVSDCAPVTITPDNVSAIMAHENRFSCFRQRRHPWAFGLTSARMAKHAPEKPFAGRRLSIVRNFRPSAGQSVRELLDIGLLPLLEKHFEIDRTISEDNYAEQLWSSIGCLAYGGTFTSELTKNPVFRSNPSFVELSQNRTLKNDAVIMRWDSYRFWESLAAGCLTFQLHLEEYGFILPAMPKAWEHYIPIRLSDLKGSVEELLERRNEWPAVAENGRAWAIANYSPVAVAKRFIAIAASELTTD